MSVLNIAGMDINIGQPKTGGGGDRFDKDFHEGDICVFIEPEAKDVDSQWGTSSAAACDYAIAFKGADVHVYEDALIFGSALAPAIYGAGTRIVAGRLMKAQRAKKGHNRAWILEPLTESDAAFVESWASKNLTVVNGRLAVK